MYENICEVFFFACLCDMYDDLSLNCHIEHNKGKCKLVVLCFYNWQHFYVVAISHHYSSGLSLSCFACMPSVVCLRFIFIFIKVIVQRWK